MSLFTLPNGSDKLETIKILTMQTIKVVQELTFGVFQLTPLNTLNLCNQLGYMIFEHPLSLRQEMVSMGLQLTDLTIISYNSVDKLLCSRSNLTRSLLSHNFVDPSPVLWLIYNVDAVFLKTFSPLKPLYKPPSVISQGASCLGFTVAYACRPIHIQIQIHFIEDSLSLLR